MSKALKLKLPPSIAEELALVATATARSTAFIAARALAAAPKPLTPPAPLGPVVAYALCTDEDDPASLLTKLKASAGALPLDEALAAAWTATRDKFQKFLAREAEARKAESADELDQALAEATHPDTPVARLVALAQSEYPRVRALVAAHPRTPHDALAGLAKDREPYVRDAVENRKLRGTHTA